MIIFSIKLHNEQLNFTNKEFKNIFTTIKDLPFCYKDDKELNAIVNIAKQSFYGKSSCKITVEINKTLYTFDVDKEDENLVFCGQMLDKNKRLENTSIEKFLRLLADNLPDMLWAKDINGHYIFANEAICKNLLMATNTDEAIGKTDVFFALREREKHKDKKDWHTFGELCFNSDEVVLENMKPMRFEEYGNVKGKLLYLEVHKAPLFDEDGRLLGTVGSGRDITQEVLAKKELEKKDRLMAQQSKMAAMGEMIGNIAHQWRQPLSMINTLVTTTMVEQEMNLLSKNELNNKLIQVQNTVEHLSSTIDDFRLFFKPNKEKKVIDIKDTLEKTVSLIAPKLNNNYIKVIQRLESAKLETLENELIQVIINILNNAEDVLKEKIIDEKLIFIDSKKQRNQIIIKIKDNAGGIPEDIISKVFEPYFTTKHQSQGTGIGLYMSEIIIQKHFNGSIKVENETFYYNKKNYKGALFTISISTNL